MRSWVLASALFLTAGFGPTPGAFGGADPSPNPSSTSNALNAVGALNHRAWAVGTYADDVTAAGNTLILEHVDRAWTQVDSPNPSSTYNELFDIVALSVDDAWAVGAYEDDSTGARETLIVHWNGTIWNQVSSPNPGGTFSGTFNELLGISATSASDIWAVGYYYDRQLLYRSLILHWNGRRWSQTKSPSPDPHGNFLVSVSASSSRDAWAVGFIKFSSSDTLTLHWDGDRWKRIPSPDPSHGRNRLSGVTATRPRNAWAVGGSLGRSQHNLIIHWDGRRWSTIKSPDPRSRDNFLTDVSARSGTDFLGSRASSQLIGLYRTLTLNWNGSRWQRIASPNPSLEHGASYGNDLRGVTINTRSLPWTVGSYYDTEAEAFQNFILLWRNGTWNQQ